MTAIMRQAIHSAIVVAISFASLPAARAQDWPAKPVRILMPYPAGGGADTITRIVGQKLAESLGQPFVVENRVGANGNIGTEALARAAPDGYTLGHGNNGNITINPHLYALSFDPLKDLVPIAMIAANTQLLFVHPAVPVRTVAELIEYAKARPGELNYASAAAGSQSHLAAELFNLRAGVKMVHVPYKGGLPAVTDVIGGRVGIMFGSAATVLPLVKAGKLRGVATTGLSRSAFTPDLPTVAEAGFPGFDVDIWYALFAPAGTPATIIRRLRTEIGRIVALGEVREALGKQGAEPVVMNVDSMPEYLRKDSARWADVVKASGAKVE
jgi:tripartite-type tricarboxylate transporter receptor subunit TctC